MSFATDFRDNVIPRMRDEAKRQGFLVALGDAEFEEAAAAVRWIAIQAGIGLLAVEHREAIFDRVPDLIWAAFEAAEQSAIDAQAARDADPVRYYDDLAAHCRDPERMRWVFAVICPEYRAYLIAERHAH